MMNRRLIALLSGLIGLLWLLPLHAAPVYVDADWLEKHRGDPSIVLIDMATDGTQYQRFHIPGAVYLPFGALVQQRRDGVKLRVDDQRLYQMLGYFGISADKHVVVYDDMGGLNAGRLFWELERIGHENVSVLEGGLVDWILSGRKVEATPVEPRRVTYKPTGGKGRNNEADLVAIKAASSDGTAAILDVRSVEEYNGQPRNKRSGHVPGAKLWSWDRSVAFDKGFTRKPVPELMASLEVAGVTDKTKPVITYCRSGHRASQSYLTLRALGFEDVRLYDGSMLEYERDKSAPLKCKEKA
jgi:thiosulfate/3-mercaptopyruvate sulfurtransferase